MFQMTDSNFIELSSLKQDYNLDIELFCYKDTEMIYKINESNMLIGIILFDEHINRLTLEYFEIFKQFRGKGYGEGFIKMLLNESKRPLYITPLPEAEGFWRKCGFNNWERNNVSMVFNP